MSVIPLLKLKPNCTKIFLKIIYKFKAMFLKIFNTIYSMNDRKKFVRHFGNNNPYDNICELLFNMVQIRYF